MLFLALKKARIVKSLFLRFPSPDKKIPPARFPSPTLLNAIWKTLTPSEGVCNKMQIACKNILQKIILSSSYNNNMKCFTGIYILSAKKYDLLFV